MKGADTGRHGDGSFLSRGLEIDGGGHDQYNHGVGWCFGDRRT